MENEITDELPSDSPVHFSHW